MVGGCWEPKALLLLFVLSQKQEAEIMAPPLVTTVVLCVTILTYKEMERGKMSYSEPETQV